MSEHIISGEKCLELLLDVSVDKTKERPSSESNKNEVNQNMTDLLTNSLLKNYNLDVTDIKIISILLKNMLDGRDETRAIDILKKLQNNKCKSLGELKKLVRLKDRGVLKIARGLGNADDNIASLLHCSYQLSDDFINSIYGRTEELPLDTAKPYKDNYEYLADQFERLNIFKNIAEDISRKLERGESISDGVKNKQIEKGLINIERTIAERMGKTDIAFPFEEFKKKNNLSRKEELVVIGILENEIISGRESYTDELLDIISQSSYEKLVDRAIFDEDGKLVKEKIIESEASMRHRIFSKGNPVKLNENLRLKLIGDKKKRKRGEIAMNGDDFFEAIKPSIPIEKVILHPKTNEELTIAIEKLQKNTANVLKEWGIKNSLQSAETYKRRKSKPSITMLFHGSPGTGKTLAANAIAYTLKRSLITIDCSKILDKWVGESEQNTRKIFDKYKAISKGKKNPPVLLLNEADQFLHRRIDTVRAVDNMYNQMQNIFLEQMERFEGVLIATTNLVENMDSAFSRRFQHKIEFRRPGTAERFKLWQVHIPEKAPLSDDVDLWYLAEHYDLSGGQIAVIVHNAATRAARRGDKIMMEDIINASKEEIKGNFDEKAKARVGF